MSMRAMVVTDPKRAIEAVERELPQPGHGEVRLKVHACGICHSDKFVIEALWPGLELPRVPGHEVAGVVDAVGGGVTRFRVGDRVGIGWHGGHDGTCDACLKGRYLACERAAISGITFDGGYQEYLVAPAVALARMPEGLDFAEAAPLLCAGVTTFNALRNSGARPGDLVAIQGLGGLGHLGVQYARAMGFETVAISRGDSKRSFAEELGAQHYVDAVKEDVGQSLQALGGASVVLATAPSAEAISAVPPGLALDGTLIVVAAPFEPIQVNAIDLLSANRSVKGWASGTATDSTDAMAFSARHGIKPMIERFPLEDAGRAVERMLSGEARFRCVLDVA